MTGLLQFLQAGGLGLLFVAVSLGGGTAAARWLGLGAALSLPVGFGCTALAGMVAFCGWWVSRAVGDTVSLALVIGAVALAAAQLSNAHARHTMRASLPATLAMLLLAAAWLCLVHAAGVPAATRFTHPLPIDDQLPRIFADRVASGNLAGPIAGDWLMSDRPPLQAGVLLLFRPLGSGSGLAGETVATLCQLMWLPALIALGQALALGRRNIAIGVAFAATSGFFLLNSVYTWPKFMAAALFLTAVAIMVDGTRAPSGKPIRTSAAIGTLLSLAVLAHGGAWFSILALPALPLAWTTLRRIGIRGAVVSALAFVAVAAPWSAYKQFVDPPGNRLMKWHLAGATEVDGRSSLEAIGDAYARTPVAELWHTRVVNFQFVTGMLGRNPDERWGDYIRRLQFFHLVPAVGLPLLGVVWLVLTRSRGRKADPGSVGLIAHAAATVLVWIVLMFQLGGTIVHQGGYAPLAVLIFLGGAAIGRWPVAAMAAVAILHVALFLAGWILTTPGAGGSSLDPFLMSAAALLSALGIAAVFPSTLPRSVSPPV